MPIVEKAAIRISCRGQLHKLQYAREAQDEMLSLCIVIRHGKSAKDIRNLGEVEVEVSNGGEDIGSGEAKARRLTVATRDFLRESGWWSLASTGGGGDPGLAARELP